MDEEKIEEEPARPVKVSDAASFSTLVSDPERLVVVAFVAEWCMLSRKFSAILEEVSNAAEFERVQFLKVEADGVPEVCKQYKVQSLPTFFFLLKGEPLIPGFSGTNGEKFKYFLSKAFTKRNQVMEEYDKAKAAAAAAEEES
eukprot:RCo030153